MLSLPMRPQLAGVYVAYYFPSTAVDFGIFYIGKQVLIPSTESLLIVLIKHALFEVNGNRLLAVFTLIK